MFMFFSSINTILIYILLNTIRKTLQLKCIFKKIFTNIIQIKYFVYFVFDHIIKKYKPLLKKAGVEL